MDDLNTSDSTNCKYTRNVLHAGEIAHYQNITTTFSTFLS